MNGGEHDETRTVRSLQSTRHEIGLMGMMNCGDGEFELVRDLVSAVSRTTPLPNYLHRAAHPNKIVKVDSLIAVGVDLRGRSVSNQKWSERDRASP